MNDTMEKVPYTLLLKKLFLKLTLGLFFCVLILMPSLVNAQAGYPDINFTGSTGTGKGPNGEVMSMALQPDGKVIIVGNFKTYSGVTVNHIARLNSDGSLDPTFNVGGTGTDTYIWSVATQADGKIWIGGAFTTYNGVLKKYLARLNSNGSLDVSWNSGQVGPGDQVRSLFVQPNGKILFAGQFMDYNGDYYITRVGRLNSNGDIDNTFQGPTFYNLLLTISAQTDNKILAGSSITRIDQGATSFTVGNLVRLTATGRIDSTFQYAPAANNAVLKFLPQSDTKIIVVGDFTTYHNVSKPGIVRLNSNGSIDNSFNSGGTGPVGRVSSVVQQVDGKYIVAGSFTSYNGVACKGIARLNSDGTLDPSFFSVVGGTSLVSSIAIQTNGLILAGGIFSSVGGASITNIARLKHTGIELSTSPVYLQNNTSVKTGGNVTDSGGASITNKGVVYSLTQNPTTALATKTNDGAGNGKFTSTITGLTPNTSYYVRAYATNAFETVYGNERIFSTNYLPVITPIANGLSFVFNFAKESIVSAGDLSVKLFGSIFKQGTLFKVRLFSDPVTLAEGIIDVNGTMNVTVTLPADTEPGAHRIVVDAVLADGTTVQKEVAITVAADGAVMYNYSATMLTLTEGSTAVTTLAATDADDPAQAITYSITGGADAGKFTINSSTGALSFINNSDFDTKTDANKDNIYQVFVSATDNGSLNKADTLEFLIALADVPEAPVVVSPYSSAVGMTAANIGAEVSSDGGGGTVTERGFVYAQTTANANPFIGGANVTKIIVTGSVGIFNTILTGLTESTNYSFKAYAVNASGTNYSNVATFNTTSVYSKPALLYTSPNIFKKDSVITPLSAINNGGIINGGIYLNVQTIAGSTAGSTDNVNPLAAKFDGPGGMTKDEAGNIYIADIWTHRIRKIDAVTGAVSTLAGSSNGFANGTGTAAQFSYPTDITYDGAGALYIADKGNHRIRKLVISTGAVTTLAGTVPFLGGGAYLDGVGTAARFNDPEGVYYVVESGVPLLYVADRGNHRIRKIVISTAVVTTFAGAGGAGSTEGAVGTAKFDNPVAVVADGNGIVYVSDYNNNKIRKIQGGIVSTFVGSASNASGSADGTGTTASFNKPYFMRFDAAGNIFVADSKNNKIRRITAQASVTTIAGSGTASTVNGIGTAASFDEPVAVLVDKNNNLAVAEYLGDVIRKINMSGYKINPALPTGLVFNDTTGVLTGISTIISPATNYKIIGNNIYGADTVTLNITVIDKPVVSTAIIGTVTSSTAVSGGVVTNANYSTVTEKGICYSTVSGTTIADNKLVTSDTSATYTIKLSGLTGATTYYVKAYAINAAGIAYGNEISFTTSIEPPSVNYSSSSVSFILNKAITPLTLNNSGGAFPLRTPSVVTTFAGSGVKGNLNGTVNDAQFSDPSDVAIEGDSVVYVADYTNGQVRKINKDEQVSTIANIPGARGLALDISGNLFVTSANSHRIYKINRTGTGGYASIVFAGSGISGSADGGNLTAQFNSPSGITVDKDGNLFVADAGNHKIRKISTIGIVSTVAGTGIAGFEDGAANLAKFDYPNDVAVDDSGIIYIADRNNNRIRKISTTNLVSTFAGTGGSGVINGSNANATFNYPGSISIDEDGAMYVTDMSGFTVRKLADGTVSSIAGNGIFGFADGTGANAQFFFPMGIAVSKSGAIYVADQGNNRIRKIDQSGITITPALPTGLNMDTAGTISGTPSIPIAKTTYTVVTRNAGGADTAYLDIEVIALPPVISYTSPQSYKVNTAITALHVLNSGGMVPAQYPGLVTTYAGSGPGNTDGDRLVAKFYSPTGFVYDKAGNLFVVDAPNNRIRKINALGEVTTFAGSSTGFLDGKGTAAKFNNPNAITIDKNGNFYVTEAGNHAVRKISPDGYVSTIAGTGSAGYKDTTAKAALFNFPIGIAIDAFGSLYITDHFNNRIRKIDELGLVTTFAGTGVAGASNGTRTIATFNAPRGIAIDSAGSFFIAEQGNHLIRKISASGDVSTFAGSTATGKVDAVGTNARFNMPVALAFNSSGDLYVVDMQNQRLRKITSTGVVTTVAGSSSGYLDGMDTTAKFNYPLSVTINTSGDILVGENGNNRIRKINLTGFSISPALPAGLTIDSTGTITGTPTSVSPLTTYTVTARNEGGVDTALLQIEVRSNEVATWTGAVNNNWNTAGNWNPAVVPTNGADIVMPGGLPNYPVLDQTRTIASLDLGTGAATILGNNNLIVTGLISGADSTNFLHTTGTGKLVRTISNATSLLFPVGNSTYNPVSITNNSGSTDTFAVRVIDEVYTNGSNGAVVVQNHVQRTWDIGKTNAGSGVDFTFHWKKNQVSGLMASKNLFHFAEGWQKQTGTTLSTDSTLTYFGYNGTFSPFAIMEPIVSLPVSWLNVSVKQQNKAALVSWSTATEQNTKDYIVQHSVNAVDWNNTGIVAAAGNSNTIRFYNYVHTQPVAGENYYRILQVDLDGRSSYSKIVKLVTGSTGAINIYPNPVVNGQMMIHVTSPGIVRIFDNKGSLVKQQFLNKGNNRLNVSNLTKGTYWLTQNTSLEKFIIQ